MQSTDDADTVWHRWWLSGENMLKPQSDRIHRKNALSVLKWLCLGMYGLYVGRRGCLCLFFLHTIPPPPFSHTHSTVYSVLWTQWPPASRPLKARLECVSCTILFQAPRSRPHLFNTYILSWGHKVGMWPGALDFGSLAPVVITAVAKNYSWPV